jgi:ABC-type multidrug transport system ATPase subunit
MKLVLENVSRSFPGRKVFAKISAVVEKGETLVITGPNGSGKTTLIRVISSILPLTSGKVIFHRDGKQYAGSEILRFIGLAAPDLFLYDELTAGENLQFFARVSGLPSKDFKDDLARFGLQGRDNDLVKSFSSGMKQRLKYVLALMKQPPLLLLDEPTSNLDDQGKMLIENVIKSHDGIVIIATNEENELKYGSQKITLGR